MRAAAPSATATPRIATASRRDATRRDGFRPSRARHRRWTTRNNDDVRRRAARGHHDDRDLDFDPYADDGRAGPPPSRAAASHGRHQSSWTATETSQDVKGVDYLVELGKQSSNTNTEVGARKGIIDDVFAGTANAKFNLGADSDIASGRLRYRDVEHVRSFKNLVGDFHVPPLFVDKVSLHVAKNLMADSENPGASANPLGGLTKVPLILGVWGAKGCGKTFNLELACKALDITPVVMSAGELEDEWAGNPGRLIRSRYRKAAEIIRNHGKMSCLIINDIDAGVGRFKRTQATVNTQMVMGTLMNLCDHPTQVSNEEDDEIHEYREEERIRRVPIIVTGNDLSTLYAPLLRDGRMEKFYWQPTRTDIADMVHAMYRDDDVSRETVERLVARHEGQPLDFFGATRARMYDRCIVEWAESFRSETPDPVTGQRHVTKAMGEHLMKNRTRERPDDEHDPGDFVLWKPDFTVQDCSEEALMRHADDLAREQRLVNEKRLSEDYMRTMKDWDEVVREDPSRRERPPPEVVAAETMTDEQRARQEALERNATEAMRAAQRQRDEERRRNPPPPEEKSSRAAPPPPKPPKLKFDREWPVVDVATAFDAFKNDGVTLVDVRGARDHDREAPVGSVNVPAVIITGRPMHWETKVNDAFEDAFAEAHTDKSKPLLILGGADATGAPDGAAVVLARLRAKGVLAGYDDIAEVDGGYEGWNKRYTPAGKKRTGKAKYTNVVGAPGTICVGSEIITQEDGVFEGLMGVNG